MPNAEQSAEVLIVGGGVAGLSTAWHLARSSPETRVVLLERENLLGSHSSGQNAAILRTASADPETAAILRAGGAALNAPPAEFSPVPLVDPVGLILIASPGEEESLAAMAAGSEGARVLDGADLQRLAPHFGGAVGLALYFQDEGRIDVAAMVEGFARGARRGGVDIRTGCGVDSLLTTGGRVEGVRLGDGTSIRAEITVLAAGGWSGVLGRGVGSRMSLRPMRRHLLVTAPDERIHAHWPVVWCLGDDYYCRPESGGLLLCACDESEVDPDACLVDLSVAELIAEKTARILPYLADLGAAHLWCGMRTFHGTDRIQIGPDPDVDGLHWVAGLGGHGMTAAFEIGRLAAERLRVGVGSNELVP